MFIGKKRVASHSRSLWLQTEAEFLDNRMYINIIHLYINKAGRPTEKKIIVCCVELTEKNRETKPFCVGANFYSGIV